MSRLPRSAGTLALAMCTLFTARAPAAITLDADFDSGSLCLVPTSACHVNGSASAVDGNVVTLVGRDNFNMDQWKWIYFRAAGVAGQQVTFQIDDDFNTGASSLNGHKMVYSYDQQTWHFFDENFRTPAQDLYTFHNDAPFNQDTVYVAYGLPYPYQRVVEHTASVTTSPWVSPTASGNEALIVGQSPGGVDDIGRTITPKNLYGYKITDPNQAGPKKRIAVLGGVHSNETLGNFVLEGLVDFLVSDELAAAQLRRYAEFYVYPMVNPDGRFAGYNRSTVQVEDVDPNRAWNPPTYVDPNNPSPTLSDVRQIGQAMRSDTGEDVDYLIDFHSTVNGKSGHYGFILPEWQSDPFWLALRALEPTLATNSASLIDFTGAKFGRDVLNAEFSATFETQFIAGENIDRFLDLGRNFGLAWWDVWNLHGDVNFDGDLDSTDWSLFISSAESDLSGLSPIERYERGDLNGDGCNDIQDFIEFKLSYEQANGVGSFAALLGGVPEPASVLLAALGAILVDRLCRTRIHRFERLAI